EAAGTIAGSHERAVAHGDGIVNGAPSLARCDEGVGELHALRALDRHEALCDPAVESPVPLGERAEPGDDTARTERDDAAEGVSSLARRGDRRDHRTAPLRIRAAHLTRLDRLTVERRCPGDVA